MATEPTYIFYTFSTGCTDGEPRWRNDGIHSVFFLDIDDARRAVVEIHDQMSNDPDAGPMTIHLEKFETVPITSHSLLSLLNGDLASFIENYEIIESFITGHKAPKKQIG